MTKTDSAKIATPPKSTKSGNSNFSIQTQIRPNSQFESVPRDTEKSELFDMQDFGDVAFSVESVTYDCSLFEKEHYACFSFLHVGLFEVERDPAM